MTSSTPEFRVLQVWAEPGDVFVESYDDPPQLEARYFEGTSSPPGDPVRLYFAEPRARKTDLVAGIQSFLVGSAHLRSILDGAGVEEVEYHRARLVCTADDSEDDGYWVLNVLARQPALDRERAEVTLFPGTTDVVSAVERLAVREDALRGFKIVRLAEVATVVLVAAELAVEIERSGLTGIRFIDVEDYGRL